VTSKEEGSAVVSAKVMLNVLVAIVFGLSSWSLGNTFSNAKDIAAIRAGSHTDDIHRRLGNLEVKVDRLIESVTRLDEAFRKSKGGG